MKICVIGLGQVGFPTAKYAQERNLEVWGYDINGSVVDKAKARGILNASSKWDAIPSVDIYIICVSTFWENDSANLDPVFEVCKKVSQKAIASTLLSIESTVVPGTSKRIFKDIFNGRINLIHVPHRYWASEPEKHGVKQLRVIGAINTDSLKLGLQFYQDLLDIPMHTVSGVEVAEMCKIVENSHRYLQIAFAEELKMICEEIGVSFEDVQEACNTKWNVDIPEAREGIGGHCLPKDIEYVISLARKSSTLLESATGVDQKYREWVSKKH